MKKILPFLALGMILLFVSCDDDEPQIDPIVGLWTLDDVEVTDTPNGYSNLENSGSDVFQEREYTIEFLDDFTYERELEDVFGQDINEDGEWDKTEDELELDPEDDPIRNPEDLGIFLIGAQIDLGYSFTIDGEITDKMTLTSDAGFWALSDDFIVAFSESQDTITSPAVGDSIILANLQQIQATITLEFDREN
jgi:hypothetical protein